MRKRKFLLGLALTATSMLALASCGSSDDKDKTIIYAYDTAKNEIIKVGSCEIIFKEDSSIPYILLEDGVGLMSEVRGAVLNDENYKYTFNVEDGNFIITNEVGAKCTINKNAQTLTYSDYDKFVNIVAENQNPLSIVTLKDNKPLKQVESQYTPGQTVTYDLNNYSRLDIYDKDDKFYLPVSVFNSLLFNTSENINLAYNGKNLYFIPAGSLSIDTGMEVIETKLGKAFREGASKDSISQEYLEYYYQSLCLDFNCGYGLRNKISSGFDSFLPAEFKNGMLSSTDPKIIDINTYYSLTYLEDNHTGLTGFSNFYAFNGGEEVDPTKINPTKKALDDDCEQLQIRKSITGIEEGIEYMNDTVFVTFDEFSTLDNSLLYPDSDDILKTLGFDYGDEANGESENTTILFSRLHKELTSGEHNEVKNIVIDLTTNGGGSSDTLTFALSTLLGEIYFDMTNPISGAHNHQVYRADINLDGEIDSKDVPLKDFGYQIYFFNSNHTFSSANAMAVAAKINDPNVITLGDKTGGGPCAVRRVITPLGSEISMSSLTTISKLDNGQYINIDGGVDADLIIDHQYFTDRNYIYDLIHGK